MDDFTEHDSGQLRLEAAGEQRSLLPLPDDQIPTALERIADRLEAGELLYDKSMSDRDFLAPLLDEV